MQAVANLAVPIVMSAAASEEGGEVGFFDDVIWKWIVCGSFNILSIYEIYHVCFHHKAEDTGFFMGVGSYAFQCPLYLVMIVAEWLHFCHIALELFSGEGKEEVYDMYNDKKNWSEEELAEWEAASEEEKEAWKAEGKTFGSERVEAFDEADEAITPTPAPEADAANKSFMQRHAN